MLFPHHRWHGILLRKTCSILPSLTYQRREQAELSWVWVLWFRERAERMRSPDLNDWRSLIFRWFLVMSANGIPSNLWPQIVKALEIIICVLSSHLFKNDLIQFHGFTHCPYTDDFCIYICSLTSVLNLRLMGVYLIFALACVTGFSHLTC